MEDYNNMSLTQWSDEKYISLGEAFSRFQRTLRESTDDAKLRFVREVAASLKSATFESLSLIQKEPIGLSRWDELFGARIFFAENWPTTSRNTYNNKRAPSHCIWVAGELYKFPADIVFDRKAFESLPIWNAIPVKHARPAGPDANDLIEIAKSLYAEGERDGKRAWKKAEANGIICTREKFLEAWAHTPNAGKPGPKGARRKKPERAG